MSTISGDIGGAGGLGAAASVALGGTRDESLGQADFLRLMTEQLKHQDPLDPMENSAFLGQLAQFSTVQGIQDLNGTVNGFSSLMQSDQLLRGTALIGRDVLVPSDTVALGEEGGAGGIVAAPGPGTVVFQVSDANGQLVREIHAATDSAGEVALDWDGLHASGERLPPGGYTVTARHTGPDGEQTDLSTYVRSQVKSVSVGGEGLYLDLDGIGTAPISYVLRVI
ncbi:MAG: flagellar hook assembly protein FlgD [Gammaproteobacteria bacterium]|nr:flagellar hook assembly protein FlgD [Gammaproteobacteria bacterium]